MPHSPLMYGLIKLHAHLEGRGETKKLAHVRAVIKIVEPDFDIARIKPKKAYKENPWFKRGEIFLAALAVLRAAEKALTQTEMAKRILAKRGVSRPSQDDLRIVRNSIKNTLPKYEGKVLIRAGANQWRIKN